MKNEEEEKLKVNQVWEAKKPKLINSGFFRYYNDRQILHISEYKTYFKPIDHGYTPEFVEWCSKPVSYRHTTSNLSQTEYEKETDKPCKTMETVFDYSVQYDSPTVKNGKNYPSIPMKEFLAWAGREVSKDEIPEGDWREEKRKEKVAQ